MSQWVSGVFRNAFDAQQAIIDLVERGFKHRISVIVQDVPDQVVVEEAVDLMMRHAKTILMGGVLGWLAGVITGFISFEILGLGSVRFGGPILSLWGLTGNVVGMVSGGLWALLERVGVPEEQALEYEEAVRDGGMMVVLEVDEQTKDSATAILSENRAESLFVEMSN